MRVGIICEYNPFHNGHKKQISFIKDKYPEAQIYCFMSGDFCQRGLPSIVNKYERARAALEFGVSAVIEIPQLWAIQAGDYFAYAAAVMFKKFKISHICFGSESDDLDKIKNFTFTTSNKQSLAKSLDGLFANDRLGFLYLKAFNKINYNINSILIKRDNIHDSSISSGKGIRKLLVSNKDYSKYCSMDLSNFNHMEPYYKIIRQILMTWDNEQLEDIHLVSDGIQNLLKKQARIWENYNDFIKACLSKKYTESRIHRTLLSILLNIKYVIEADNYRLLGFNKGISKDIKDNTYSGHPKGYEIKVMDIYALGLKDPHKYLEITKKGVPIIILKKD